MTTAVDSEVRPVLLMLVDISGYTDFLVSHGKELRHSQMIIGELLESLMEQVDVPLRISQTEGDALFLYAVKSGSEDVWRRRSGSLVEKLLTLFQVFKERLLEIQAYSICMCQACAMVGDLDLKIVVHSGEALLSHVGQFPTLSGVDVITLHRLAKNSVPEKEYVLMTESAFKDLQIPEGAEVREGVEEYDTGVFKTFTYLPEVDVILGDDEIRSRFSDENAAVKILRDEIAREYSEVALEPEKGFHFNTGRSALTMNDYQDEWLEGVPESVIESFSGMGNPLSMGLPADGEYVVDIGSGAGLDSMIAAKAVGPAGHVIGVEMTQPMIDKASRAKTEAQLDQLEYRQGHMESLPIQDGWADLVISNGAVNLAPDKERVFREIYRVLRPGGRIQIGDITVEREVPDSAKGDIDLWAS